MNHISFAEKGYFENWLNDFLKKIRSDLAEMIGYHDFEDDKEKIETTQKIIALNDMEIIALYLMTHNYYLSNVTELIEEIKSYPLPFVKDPELLMEENLAR